MTEDNENSNTLKLSIGSTNEESTILSFSDKLTKVISFYNLTNSEVCSICNISRKTLNELLYENNLDAEINTSKIDVLYDIINDLSVNKDVTLNPSFLPPLLKYLNKKEIIYTVAKRIVLDILQKSENYNNKKTKKTSLQNNREEEESKKESFLFFKKMLSIYPFIPSLNNSK